MVKSHKRINKCDFIYDSKFAFEKKNRISGIHIVTCIGYSCHRMISCEVVMIIRI